jgi:O-antigen ligase
MTRLMLFLLVLSLPLGQIARVPLPYQNVHLYLGDILLVLALVSFLPKHGGEVVGLARRRGLGEGWLFVLAAILSTLASLRLFSPREVFIGSLYLLRFAAYFLLVPMVMVVFARERLRFLGLLIFSGVLLAGAGWVQLVTLPNLAPLARYGWDPHQSRLVSTQLDPNFTGALLVWTMIMAASAYLARPKNLLITAGLLLFLYFSLVYTFSRSAYLMFLMGFLAIGYLKSWKVALLAVLAFFLSFQFNPRVEQRVGGAISVDASAEHRLTSWERAEEIIKKYPVLGVGFNNFRAAQLKLGFIDPQDRRQGGHGGAGTDSSFLFVLATTGVVGGAAFAVFLFRLFRELTASVQDDAPALASVAGLFGLLFHAQFVNSLFYPPMMVLLFSTVALAFAKEPND